MVITREEAREIIFNTFRRRPTLDLQADNPASFPEAPILNQTGNLDKVLEVCSELLADKIVYQSSYQRPTIYKLTEKGTQIITENWTETTATERFIDELRREGLIFDTQLEKLIFEFNQAQMNRLDYSANLVLTLASEKALDKLMQFRQSQFGQKLIELEEQFKTQNAERTLNLTQRKILNYAHQMHEYRNSYAHLNPTEFNFTQERQNFVSYLKNIKIVAR